ncbi:hypothetical protein ACFX15_012978 [Malus domestica]
MGLFGTIQSAIVTLILEHDLQVWNIHSTLEIVSGLFAGFATGLTFSFQTWCVSIRGPLFVAMFTPLCTVITTIVAAVFLHEELYLGSLVGGVAVVIGLYIVLWGKAKDQQKTKQETDPNQSRTVDQILIDDDSTEKTSCKIDLEEPLLKKKNRRLFDYSAACTNYFYLTTMLLVLILGLKFCLFWLNFFFPW